MNDSPDKPFNVFSFPRSTSIPKATPQFKENFLQGKGKPFLDIIMQEVSNSKQKINGNMPDPDPQLA